MRREKVTRSGCVGQRAEALKVVSAELTSACADSDSPLACRIWLIRDHRDGA